MCEDLSSTAAEAQTPIYHISCQYIYSVISKGRTFLLVGLSNHLCHYTVYYNGN